MKKINRIYKLVLPALIFVGITVGCDDELNKLPPQSVDNETALSSEANVLQVLNGAYDAISNGDLFGGEVLRNSELLAADAEIIFTGTFNAPAEIWRKEMLTTNADVSEMWLDGYKTINTANNIIDAVERGIVETDPDGVRGEALFLRGLVYFELAKYFGQPYSAGNTTTNLAVPIVLEPTRGIDSESFPPRSSVEDVYNQAESDLSSAAGLLPASNAEYANSVAAYVVLTRLRLQKGDYSGAKTANDAALAAAAGIYDLTSVYDDAFNRDANSVEDIFSIQVLATDGVNAMQTFYASQFAGGRGDIEILDRHLDFYDPADDRLAFYLLDPSTGETRTGKWDNQFGNVGAIRYAELLLNQAEIEFRLNGAGAVVDAAINQIRNRVNLGNITVTDLNQIFLERKLELAHEGHAIHDFRRTQGAFYQLEPAFGAVDTSGDGQVDGFAYDATLLVYPIPDREIQANTNLVQNDDY